ncbi:YkvA family protein [Alsobacter sp. R-9]
MADDVFSSTFSKAEIEAMRRAARDEATLGEGLFGLMRRFGSRIPFAEDALAAWYCATDPTTERRVKLILLGAIGYFVLPADLVPDILPLIGFGDDAAVIAAAVTSVARAIKPEHRERARGTLGLDPEATA